MNYFEQKINNHYINFLINEIFISITLKKDEKGKFSLRVMQYMNFIPRISPSEGQALFMIGS